MSLWNRCARISRFYFRVRRGGFDQNGCAAGTKFTGTSETKVLSQRVHSSIPACSEGMWPKTIRALFFFSLTASAAYSTVSHSRDSPVINNWMSGFLISALGGSSTQIGGPTGAFVVVVFGIVTRYGVEGLYLCTLMAGVFLVILGATGLGTAVKFIPRPVVVGFTSGIAVIIASTQIKDFFWIES